MNDVDERPAACGFVGFGNHIALDVVDLAPVGEEQDMVVRGTDEHIFHEVLFLGLVTGDTHAATVLRLVFGDGQALGVTAVRHGDDHVLYLD